MRIIAGRYKNREIGSPHSKSTHPMSEQVRGAIFNALGDITNLTVLDAFAGSGAVGLEALSRGAKHVTFIESDKRAARQITENIKALRLQAAAKLTQATALAWSETTDAFFDIVIIDPPYHDLQLASVTAMAECVATNGTVVLSWPGKQAVPQFDRLTLIKVAQYGDAQLAYYQ